MEGEQRERSEKVSCEWQQEGCTQIEKAHEVLGFGRSISAVGPLLPRVL